MQSQDENYTGKITSLDDPRLSAYVLNELAPEDIAHVEAFLAGSEDGRREVEDIRAMTGALAEELAMSPDLRMTDTQHASIESALTGGGDAEVPAESNSSRPTRGGTVVPLFMRAAAAALVIVGVGLWAFKVADSGDAASSVESSFTYDLFGRQAEPRGGAGSKSAAPASAINGPSSASSSLVARDDDERALRDLLSGLGYSSGSAAPPTDSGALRALGYVDAPADDGAPAKDEALRRRLRQLGYLDLDVTSTEGDAAVSMSKRVKGTPELPRRDRVVEDVQEVVDNLDLSAAIPSDGLEAALGTGQNGASLSSLGEVNQEEAEAGVKLALVDSAEMLGLGGGAADEFRFAGGKDADAKLMVARGGSVDALPGRGRAQRSDSGGQLSLPRNTRYPEGSASSTGLVKEGASQPADQPLIGGQGGGGGASRVGSTKKNLWPAANTPAASDLVTGAIPAPTPPSTPGSVVPVTGAPALAAGSAPVSTKAAPPALSTPASTATAGVHRNREAPADRSDLRARLDSLGYIARQPRARTNDAYKPIHENPFTSPLEPGKALSTFSIDVDTASYANVRRYLQDGALPPADAVRLEELLNYFDYGYVWPPEGGETDLEDASPVGLHVATTGCPWAPEHRLVRLAVQARPAGSPERPAANLVFLVDVSGSMRPEDRLPLLKTSLRLLVGELEAKDRVSIVTYNDGSSVTLPSTSCDQKTTILSCLASLSAGGSTNGEAGLRLAYATAKQSFIQGGVNRVILATDGDFNVGATSEDELHQLITSSAKTGVFLTVLGFGRGNLKDANLELLADRGNGHYAYIDSLSEGQKVLMEEAGSTLEVVAKDVKIQLEFNPGKVAAYRLLGYENRALANHEFNDDGKDAGEVGAGHSVTALYEIVPVGVNWQPTTDPLKYQKPLAAAIDVELVQSPELLTAKLRWKWPGQDVSNLITQTVIDDGGEFPGADTDLKFTAAVASFGMLLRGSRHAGAADWDTVIAIAQAGRGPDSHGWRAEFIRLAKLAKGLTGS